MNNDELKEKLAREEERVRQLEESIKKQNMFLPNRPDLSLGPDEWYAIFNDYKNPTEGLITKIHPKVLLGSSALFKVKRIG